MRRAAVVAALIASAAEGQVLVPGAGTDAPVAGDPANSAVKARYRFDRIGAVIPHQGLGLTTQPTLHLVWNGTALVDIAASPVGIAMQGTVPQVATGPWYPSGFASATKPGAGPFSTSNYYRTTLGDAEADVGDITGAMILCVVYEVTTAGTIQIAHDGVSTGDGWGLSLTATQTVFATWDGGAATTSTHTGGGAAGTLHVACAGRDGAGNQSVKADLASITTTAGSKAKADATRPLTIGVYNAASGAFTGTIREVVLWAEAISDAKLIAIQKWVLGMHGSRGPVAEPLTFTRATTASCPLPYEGQTSYLVPAGVPCINGGSNGTNGGLRVEPARTNYALNSATNPKTAEASSALSTGAHVAWFLGPGTMTIAAGTATVTGLDCTAVAAGTVCSFTVTGGGTMAITTSDAATHVQIENGAYRTSMIATAGTAVARNADVATAATAAPYAPGNNWCLTSTITPLYARALSGASAEAWSWGPTGNNSAAAVFGTGSFVLTHTDGSGGVRTYTTSAADAATTSGTYTGCVLATVPGWWKGLAKVAGAAAGAGTGTWTSPTTLYLGSNNSAGSELGGYLRNVKLCPRSGVYKDCR